MDFNVREDEKDVCSKRTNGAIVFSALELAYDLRGGPVTAEDVQIVGTHFEFRDELPPGEVLHRGWTPPGGPFDYRDRVEKHLERLVHRGVVERFVSPGGRSIRYAPTSVVPLGRAEALQKLLGAREPALLLAAPTVGGLTAARELNRLIASEVEDLSDMQDLDEVTSPTARGDAKLERMRGLIDEVGGIEEREGVEAARQFIEERVLGEIRARRRRKRRGL